ncbi:polypeptide N-acetylgalactosaminyltransferase [Mactra antiquata]
MKIREALTWIVLLYFSTLVVLVYRLHDKNTSDDDEILEYRNVFNISTLQTTSSKTESVKLRTNDKVTYKRYGPGENGEEVIFSPENISFPGLAERNKKHGFNTFISDMISLHRKLPDMRPDECKTRVYPDDLPPVSIVIIFRDEWWSILLRTVYSILEMSPPKLISEIILVDDGSKDITLVTTVKIHIKNLEKVKLVQNGVSRGLMMARQAGINAVQTDIFIVMDGHMEVGPGWLEPLLYRMVQQPKSLLCSHIGGIHKETFEFIIDHQPPEGRTFDAQFPFFDHVTLDQMFATYSDEYRKQRNHSVEPIPYGTIQGMMMVMRKDFFQQLGGFDPGMKVWGSEQIELSVKVWMCGGVVEMVPCSTVAHMFRVTPWSAFNDTNDFHSLNKARMTQVWLDPPYNDAINSFLSDKNYSMGDITSRQEIREVNHCKPYQYFIDKVKSFSNVYLPIHTNYKGSIINGLYHNRCLDAARSPQGGASVKLILYPCHRRATMNQYFILSDTDQIRGAGGMVIDVRKGKDDISLYLRWAPVIYFSSSTIWTYDGNQLKHKDTSMCLTALTQDKLGLSTCIDSRSQTWKWGKDNK